MISLFLKNRFGWPIIIAAVVFLLSAVLCTFFTIYLPAKITINMRGPETCSYKVYFDIGAGYTGKQAVTFHYVKSEDFTELVCYSPMRKIEKLRIDPGKKSGITEIKSIVVEKYDGQRRVWNAEEIARDFHPLNDIASFTVRDTILYVESVGDDPQFETDTIGPFLATNRINKIYAYLFCFGLSVVAFLGLVTYKKAIHYLKVCSKNRNLVSVCFVLAVVFPILFALFAAITYRLGMYWDHWDQIFIVQKYYSGELTFHDLWAQHNEHRLIIPRVLFLIVAVLTNWNHTYELLIGFLSVLAKFSLISYIILKTKKSTDTPSLIWSIPVVSWLIFSLSNNLSFQESINSIQWNITTFFAVAAFVTVSYGRFSWPRFLLSFVLCTLSLFTSGSGIPSFPAALLVLACATSFGNRTEKVPSLLIWVLGMILIFSLYSIGFHKLPYPSSLFFFLDHPFTYLLFVLIFVGAPICSSDVIVAVIFGTIGIVFFFWALWFLSRKTRAGLSTYAPYLSLGLFSLFNALLIGVGRVSFGLDCGVQDRYIGLSTPLWISNTVLFVMVLSVAQKTDRDSRAVKPAIIKRAQRAAVYAIVFLLVISFGLSYRKGYRRMVSTYNDLKPAYEMLVHTTDFDNIDKDLFKRLYPNYDERIKGLVIFLKEHNMSMFR